MLQISYSVWHCVFLFSETGLKAYNASPSLDSVWFAFDNHDLIVDMPQQAARAYFNATCNGFYVHCLRFAMQLDQLSSTPQYASGWS